MTHIKITIKKKKKTILYKCKNRFHRQLVYNTAGTPFLVTIKPKEHCQEDVVFYGCICGVIHQHIKCFRRAPEIEMLVLSLCDLLHWKIKSQLHKSKLNTKAHVHEVLAKPERAHLETRSFCKRSDVFDLFVWDRSVGFPHGSILIFSGWLTCYVSSLDAQNLIFWLLTLPA